MFFYECLPDIRNFTGGHNFNETNVNEAIVEVKFFKKKSCHTLLGW